jgi:hypothetical protein
MEFVHACYLSLYLQFQCLDRRSHRGGSTSRTKGSATMSPRRRLSKRVRSTPPKEAAHGFCTRRSSTGKRVEVAAVGEHNSPSRPTLGPYLALRETPHGQIMIALLTRSPLNKLLSPPHPQNNESCLGWYYLTDVYQSICTSYLISM